MQDNNNIIHTLSSATINQIAAGEVVQRPASVVKELMENAIDAGATKVDVVIADAGKTLVQVIDNGKGMSAEDSVKAFERHATSKINDAEDLYSLTTMGFRGEALASIAAVSRVELKSRRPQDELGSHVELNGGELAYQEFTSCQEGTRILVKDLFYNIPVRRKFLKKNETELRNILNVFQQVALVYPTIRFSLTHNNSTIFNLGGENYKQRITSIFGDKTGKELLTIKVETGLININGFISTPSAAVRKQPLQYLFVNGRYIQHPYFAKAVSLGYEKIIPSDVKPHFFLFLDVEPDKIDVNIHPTKTEVKFEDEQAIFPIIVAAVRDALVSSCSMPSLDFDQDDKIDIPISSDSIDLLNTPPVTHNPDYNPFTSHKVSTPSYGSSYSGKSSVVGWESLYVGQEKSNMEEKLDSYMVPDEPVKEQVINIQPTDVNVKPQFKGFSCGGKYIVCSVEGGVLFVNSQRASMRILYDKLSLMIKAGSAAGQMLMFPELIEFNATENIRFEELKGSFESVGYSFELFGKTAWKIMSVPSVVSDKDALDIVKDIVADADVAPVAEIIKERLIVSLAERGTHSNAAISNSDAAAIIDSIYDSNMPAYTPQGNLIYYIVDFDSIKNKIG